MTLHEKGVQKMFNILKFFPKQIAEKISQENIDNLEEIRLRVNNPIILKYTTEERILDYEIKQEEMLKILQLICENSIYSYQNQICNRIYYIRGRK